MYLWMRVKRNRPNGVLTDKPFQPDFEHFLEFMEGVGKLSEESKAEMQKPVNRAELQIALEKSENGKAPGLDGFSYELYKATEETVGEDLVNVMNCQLDRLRLMKSNLEGATRLHSKAESGVVPRVDQLRPITLLTTDYKLLTSILSNRLMKILQEIILSGQLCSVRGQNIHFGTHDLISALSYLEEQVEHGDEFGFTREHAAGGVLVSYDLYKAYDRVSIDYLTRVLRHMNFGETFIAWVKMLHAGASTRFILNCLSKPVNILISIRQGDPLAMVLFIIFIEPLLMQIKMKARGLSVLGLRENQYGWELYRGGGHVVMEQNELGYVDDINVVLGDPEDMLTIDEVFRKFEKMSGALLNRSEKTKCLGLGKFEGRKRWPLPWIKVESSIKVFGVRHFSTYKKTIDANWSEVLKNFSTCLMSWNTRVLNSVFQRTSVLNIFALPRLWYMAECLPLPADWAHEFEKLVFAFLKMGKMEMLPLQELYNPVHEGGLGLVCVRSKADSLFLKQTLRMLNQPKTTHWKWIKFYAGWEFKIGFMRGTRHHKLTPYYEHMMNLFQEGQLMDLCHYCHHRVGCEDYDCKDKKLRTTAKEIYAEFTTFFPPPKVEYKPAYSNVSTEMWGRVWSRVASPMIDPMSRQVIWRGVHDILPTRERIKRMGLSDLDGRKVTNAYCNRCDLGVVDTVTHMFSECKLVREAWCWVRRRLMDLLPRDMADLSNTEFLMMMFPREHFEDEMVWILGVYMGWVYEEAVVKGRVLGDGHIRGYMRYMYFQSKQTKMPQLGYISEVTIHPQTVFDNG